MSAIFAAGLLVSAVIEITGLPAILAVLLPIAVLVFVVLRYARAPASGAEPTRPSEQILRALPDTSVLNPEAASQMQAETADAASDRPSAWEQRIEAAKAANDHSGLAVVYLEYARETLSRGSSSQAADYLRTSVGSAVKGRNKQVQAEARLELADLARQAGDLTTACEHWQIARALFYELKQEPQRAETEGLMLKHGCPTDWVLNDF